MVIPEKYPVKYKKPLPEKPLSEGTLPEKPLSEGTLPEKPLSEGTLPEKPLTEKPSKVELRKSVLFKKEGLPRESPFGESEPGADMRGNPPGVDVRGNPPGADVRGDSPDADMSGADELQPETFSLVDTVPATPAVRSPTAQVIQNPTAQVIQNPTEQDIPATVQVIRNPAEDIAVDTPPLSDAVVTPPSDTVVTPPSDTAVDSSDGETQSDTGTARFDTGAARSDTGTARFDTGAARFDTGTEPPMSNEELTRHTAELWQYKPVPRDVPEPFPEYAADVTEFPGGWMMAARVRGKKHKHEGTNCDDWYEIRSVGPAAVVAVSDGAGSKPFSRIGARDSCRVAVGYLTAALGGFFTARPDWRGILRRDLTDPETSTACAELAGLVQTAALKAREAVGAAYYTRLSDPIYTEFSGRGLQERDFSATLLLAVIVPLEGVEKEQLIVSCQIGDGEIVALNTGASTAGVKLLGAPDSGTYAGETEFLTSAQMGDLDALRARTRMFRGIADTVFVMTDGVADDYYPARTEMIRLYFDLVVNGILSMEPAGDANGTGPGQNPTAANTGHGPANTGYGSGSMGNPSEAVRHTVTVEEMRRFKEQFDRANFKMPDPVVFPWINDRTREVGLQYTDRICERLGLTPEDIWRDPRELLLCRISPETAGDNPTAQTLDAIAGPRSPQNPSVRLLVRWLDNYVKRSSFDDRTLVIVRM